MTTQNIGIEDARKRLGDLVTAVQQGSDVVLTRNGKPAARLVRYVEEMVSLAELARRVGMQSAPEKVARWAGCLAPHDPRTGTLPKPWHGMGMDAAFTAAQADQLEADWHRDRDAVEDGDIYDPYPGYDPDWEAGHSDRVAEVQDRFRP